MAPDLSPRPSAVRFWFRGAEDLGSVILASAWIADNGVETATFPTLAEAHEFACKRWGWEEAGA